MPKKKIHNQREFHWRAPEYEHHEKTLVWFICAGIVALGLIIYGLFTDGWSFSLAILACCVAYYAFHRHTPEVVDIRITARGMHVGRHFFPYAILKKFWIYYDPPAVSRLYVRFRSRFHPDLTVSLGTQDPGVIRRVLKQHLSEWEDGDEPMADTFIRILKL